MTTESTGQPQPITRLDGSARGVASSATPEHPSAAPAPHPAPNSAGATAAAPGPGAAGVRASPRFPPPDPATQPLVQTIRLSDILPVVRCVHPTEAQFVHQHVFFGRIGGYGLKHLGIAVKPGDTVVDVGSNIGNFAMWLLKELKGDVRLVVVEPVPALAACLAANVEQYAVPGLTRATVVNAGCTRPDKAVGTARLTFNPGYTLLSTTDPFSGQELEVMAAGLQRYTGRDDRSELQAVVEQHLAPGVPTLQEVEAPMATLSGLLAEELPSLERIDLLKIDAVKSEWDILQGIADEDWAKVRQAVIEVHLGGDVSRLDKVVGLLKQKGFTNVRTGWPGTPTFLAYKEYGMIKAAASARDAAALSASVHVPAAPAPAAAAGAKEGAKEVEAVAAPPVVLPALPPPPKPSAEEHLLCAVYATRD
ncbi:hypothetical protein HYH02_009614 [Chlamydomonas schloesseri]|uniref:Methyltransferase FkbM domain-containing protein n=1 Tax=Chlamydomonas schloesseri TaxID=2026947 RepID=A0A835TNC2_9CHLO|nr:hypothetical protein HYH02_009614 [Chlamydomonas schloesseri]|eukprot:KAG2442125.1 hypothetical protein HYH02_009614 [Chlamydomonas schloesseri]